ncbi:magnesium transporter [Actinophytocola glycyrrhizae]|uniref:Magnesium transporter n=1 Tax=Actinophytocola glycyrrhizae TaxID=2044873 RepID=A0ABV9RZA4_9PSEU
MITMLVVIAIVLFYTARRRKRRGTANPARRRGRVASLVVVAGILGMQAIFGSPAMAQQQDTSCAPFPERPGAGMVGAIDPSQGNGEAGGPYTNEKFPNSPYLDHGYAGMVWHVYDPNCQQPLSISDPSVTIDTWAGNELFNLGKNIVGATNSLHYTLYNGGVLGGLNQQIGAAANAIFDNIYMQLFSIFMLVLAVLMFRQIWRGDLAAVSKRGLFALGGMWLAASTLVLVSNYDAVDRLIVETTTGIQNGFRSPDEDRIQRDVLPTELHTRIVYENWLRGEFGQPNAPQAEEFGRPLLNAQAWTWEDLASGNDANDQAEAAKRAEYQRIYNELGSAQGYFSGTEGSRTGSGFLAFFQSLVYSLFQFLAKLAVLLAQLLLRIFTLAAPVIGLVALVHHDILRKVGRAVGAVVLNVLVLAMLAGIHFKFLQLIFGPDVELSMLTQMLLAGIVTLVFLLVGRPVKRMWQMVELSVGAAGASVPSASRGGLFSRFRRGKGADERGPQDEFWDNLRDEELAGDTVAATNRGGRRSRPEAAGPVMATAERLDTRRQPIGQSALGLPPARGDGEAVLMPAGPGGRNDPAGALPPRRSRVVDTTPVYDRDWGEDAMVVPSQVSGVRNESRFDAASIGAPRSNQPVPRPADVEMVAGRPVHVVYRPSRGLEVREPAPRRMPLRDGPRETDAAVR